MRKVILLAMLAMMCSITISAQKKKVIKVNKTATVVKAKPQEKHIVCFNVNEILYVSMPDSSKSFYVFNYPGEKARILYDKAVKSIMNMFQNPNQVMTKVDGQMINLKCGSNFVFMSHYRRGPQKDSVSYKETYMMLFNFNMEFKDGKIKITVPTISQIIDLKDYVDMKFYYTFKEPEFVYKENRVQLEFNINHTINEILAGMEDKTENDW